MATMVNIISTTDNRAQAQADEWHRRFGREQTYQITGTTTHPSLMLPKILWIRDHLDDVARIDKFVTAGKAMLEKKESEGPQKLLWEVPAGTVPDELSTQVWVFADEKHVYIAARCRDRLYPLPPGQQPRRAQERNKVEEDYPYNWRQPCLDINLDVQHDHKNTFHVIVDPLGQVYDEYLGCIWGV